MQSEVQKIEYLAANTPFHMEKYWKFISENHNVNCSHEEIEKLIEKRILTLVDIEIMKALASYHYCNSSNLSFYLNYTMHDHYQKENYLSNLNKLKRAGIVMRYCLINTTDSPIKEFSPCNPVSPLRLYHLSPAGYTYVEPLTGAAHPQTQTTSIRKLELAALNQFLIRFFHHYPNKIQDFSYKKIYKIGTSLLTIDALIRYRTEYPLFQTKEFISFILLSIRETNGWIKNATNRLRMLNIWLRRHEENYPIPFVLLLVENIPMMISLYAQVQTITALQSLPLYFCPDGLLMVYPPLSCIYSCKVSEDHHIQAIRQSILI